MNIVTLAEIKAHTRIDSNAEDSLLELYAESAEEFCLDYIDRTLDEVCEIWGYIPARLKEAVLMLVDHSYTHRSPASPQQLYQVPYSIDAKLRPLRKL